jgi:hypothetical protein
MSPVKEGATVSRPDLTIEAGADYVRGCTGSGAELETTVDQALIRGLGTAFRVFVSGLFLGLEDGRRRKPAT